MKNRLALLLISGALVAPAVLSALERDLPSPAPRARTELAIPAPPGFQTLKCDFHMHTVFSDGIVWPTVRVDEAWRHGLGAIAITDHIEYQPHKEDVLVEFNRSFELAKAAGDPLGLIVIRGAEITRPMPPGHLNALFLQDCAALDVPEWADAVKAAHAQGAFIFWNHPGWESQVPDGIAVWRDEHSRILKEGMLHGIELINGRSYYPEAHRWAIEKKLAVLCDSDVHGPIDLDYAIAAGDRRPMTLVFAKERSERSIQEALVARRSAAFAGGTLIGCEEFLRPIFDRSIRVTTPEIVVRGRGRVPVQAANDSDIDYQLERAEEMAELNIPKRVLLPARKTILLFVQGKDPKVQGQQRVSLPYLATNVLVGPDKPLAVAIGLGIRFNPPTPPKK